MREQKVNVLLLSNTFPFMESLVGTVGRLHVEMAGCQNGGMSEWRDFGMGVATLLQLCA